MTKGITVTAEDYGSAGELDVIVVRIDGEEVGSFCVVMDAEAERASVQEMVSAIERRAQAELREDDELREPEPPALTEEELADRHLCKVPGCGERTFCCEHRISMLCPGCRSYCT